MLKKLISLLTGNKKETPAPLSPTVAKKKPQEPIAEAPKPSPKAAKPEPPIQVPKPETTAPQQPPAESKADRPVTPEAATKHIDYSKFIHLGEQFIRVADPHGELDSLPDNFFEAYEKIESVYLYLTKVQDLPVSLSRLATLTGLDINCPKLKQLPAFMAEFKNLQHLHINCPQMRVEEQFLILTQLNNLSRLTISGYYGNKWPAILEQLTQLRYLNITIDSKKTDQLEMIRSVGKMKWLKEVSFRGGLNLEQIGDEIIALDHLESASLWDTNPVTRPEFLNWGLLRHVSFRLPYKAGEMTFDDFKVAIQSDKFDDNARRLLFGFFAKQYNALKAILPNLLLTAAHDKGQEAILFFEYKPVKTLSDRLKEQSSKANIRIAAKVELNCYHIIG
ncbi:MAG: hypothetical protein IT258_22750, partial [Saprospiraceae bacterium]|nr:hypothetical protein [Saprospiraceae bacterium]